MQNRFSNLWPWFFYAAAFESLLAIISLFLIPSEGGLSPARIALLGTLTIFLFFGIYCGSLAHRGLSRFDKFAKPSMIFSAALLAGTSSLILFLLRYLNPGKLLPYYERLSPLLWYILVVSVQSVIFLLLVKNGFNPREFSKRKSVYKSALLAFCVLFAAFLFVAFTKIGITPDSGYWGEPGVAIQGWQFIISIIIGCCILVCALNFSILQSSRAQNFILPFLIWIAASFLWLSVPVGILQNSFYAPISPPLDIPLPYSDAAFYDYLSQSLLIGANYLNGIPPRPLYVLFLAILHYFFGQDYASIILVQTLALAFFPVILYFLGKKLHSTAAGVTVAFFAIFRELVGLWLSSNIRVVNSKIFTTDFPTAMTLAYICLVFLWWLEKRDLRSTLMAGGAFGLALLFRTQSLFALPFVFFIAWFSFQRKTKEWILAGVVFGIAMVLAIMPWLIHNHAVSGHFTFDDPKQMAIIYSQYSKTGNLDITKFDPETQSVANRVFTFTLENPAYVSNFVATHFINTEIGGLLALPLIKRFDGVSAPVNIYWGTWDGSLEWYNYALLIFYLVIGSVGIGAAWLRARWVGLLPLAINIGYALANGISRFSSWRYNLPIDWVFYFYFAIGAIEIFGGIALLLGTKHFENGNFPVEKSSGFSPRDFRPQYLLILIAFAVIGATPWIAKDLVEPRYASTKDELISNLEKNGYAVNEIDSFLSQPSTILTEGRMLYPRLYHRGEGMSSANPWPAYAISDHSRIGFVLLNESLINMTFNTKDRLNFPQGADAIVLACQADGYFDVRIIAFGNKSFLSAPLTDPCN